MHSLGEPNKASQSYCEDHFIAEGLADRRTAGVHNGEICSR